MIADLLGAGGMGEVYRATDTRLDRTVAINVLPEHLADRVDLCERFEREARAAEALNHPSGSRSAGQSVGFCRTTLRCSSLRYPTRELRSTRRRNLTIPLRPAIY